MNAAPHRRQFLTADWRYLAMLNYQINPAELVPYLPRGTELDLWQGKCLVSVVGFLFRETRVLGWSIPGHRNFEEVNLRFYVRRKEAGAVKRGVVFIKEIVPKRAIAWVARKWYGENYHCLPMRHEVSLAQGGDAVRFEWYSNRRWEGLSLQVQGEPTAPATGSEEQFIVEHYWGYAWQKNGSTVEYEVEHPPWRVWQVRSARLDCDVEGIYGRAFVEVLGAEPVSAFVAEGSPVAVYQGRVVKTDGVIRSHVGSHS